MTDVSGDRLVANLRTISDFPEAGINFYDITSILKDGELFHETMNRLEEHYRSMQIDAVVGMESRGLIYGAALADRLGAGFIPARKPGKLPGNTESVEFQREYGPLESLHIHRDDIVPGAKYLVIDDILATGGTAAATVELIEKLGGKVVECGFIIELSFLNGREPLGATPVFTLIQRDS